MRSILLPINLIFRGLAVSGIIVAGLVIMAIGVCAEIGVKSAEVLNRR
jgi:hypothetical protein